LSTTPITAGGATPTLPLTPDARKAYQDLYTANETAIENTTDGALLQSLNDTQLAIGGVLSADNEYRLNQDTAQFNALLAQINTATAALKKLQADIAGIASKVSVFGAVAGGIAKVLSFLPAL
jgi:ABC-type transporter Mla subunit MlaD